jgi:hypothetical protein
MASNGVVQAREKAYILYEGKQVPHYSCGICLAATFGLPTRSYQALRRGGIHGEGECGAIVAGRLVLGHFMGDPDPTGPVREELREAMAFYQKLWLRRTEPGQALTRQIKHDIICNTLVGHLADDFFGEERTGYCTRLSAEVAACVAETLEKFGVEVEMEALHGPNDGD